MTTILSCPLCNSSSFEAALNVKDHTVSQETFQIQKCRQCQFLFTSPVPENLAPYYQSPQYISHSNQAAGITDHLYKLARNFTLTWKTRLINKYNRNNDKSLLDFGCGTGAFLAAAKKSNWSIAGVEPADHPRSIASNETQTDIKASLNELNQKKYNTITLWHVLEHIPALHQTVQHLSSLLDDHGTIFIAVPNHNSQDAQHYQQHWAAYDTPRHLWHFTQPNMQQLLTQHQLKLVATVPMKLDAYYVSILSEKYKHDNKPSLSSLLIGMFHGMQSNIAAASTHEYSSLIYIARK